jgi:hypothetical protein
MDVLDTESFWKTQICQCRNEDELNFVWHYMMSAREIPQEDVDVIFEATLLDMELPKNNTKKEKRIKV